MANFSIGLSGLHVAQRAIELIGTNIANATTEGYHRQDMVLRPVDLNTLDKVSIGGVEIGEVRRAIDNLLEREIVRHQTGLGQAVEELDVLSMIESAFGEVGSEGLCVALDRFFETLTELSADPTSQALREQVVWAADGLAGEFRNVGRFLADVRDQVRRRAGEYVDRLNGLLAEAAELTKQINAVRLRGGSANLLTDRRDQIITELAELADVTVRTQPGGIESIEIVIWGDHVVSGSVVTKLQIQDVEGGKLGIGAEGDPDYRTDVSGGRIGGVLALYNDSIADIRGSLDTLANQIITAINDLHVQGVGSSGSFTELTGLPVATGTLDGWSADVTSGSFYVRVIDTATGGAVRHEISVDPTVDTVTDIRDRLHAIGHLSASIENSALRIEAEAGYRFDFMPALSSGPYTSTLTGAAVPTISGIYTGDTNQEFTCTVVGTGDVGVDDDLVLEVRNGANELVKTVNVGLGYAAGDLLDIGYGMSVSLSTGDLNAGEAFTIQALADSDTSGFLAAAGINTLFSGSASFDMAVRPEVLNQPQRLAGTVGADGTDGVNIRRMADVGLQADAALDDVTPRDYLRQLVTGVGQAVVVRQARKTSLENVMRQLGTQKNDISGVDINEEAAKLMMFERMFQAMSKVISTQNYALQYLFDLV